MKTLFDIKESPYGLLLLTASALLCVPVFLPFSNLDFQRTTLFSIPLSVAVWVFPLILISVCLIYLLTRKFLYSLTITWIHVLVTTCVTILLVTVLYLGASASQLALHRSELIGNIVQVLVILFVCGQLAFITNLLLGILIRPRA